MFSACIIPSPSQQHRSAAAWRAGCRRGQSIVEFAIFLPILTLLIAGAHHLVMLASYQTQTTAISHTLAREEAFQSARVYSAKEIANAFGVPESAITVRKHQQAESSERLVEALARLGDSSTPNSEQTLRDLLVSGFGQSVEVELRIKIPNGFPAASGQTETVLRASRPIPGQSWKPEEVQRGLKTGIKRVIDDQLPGDPRSIFVNSVPDIPLEP